MGSDIQAVREAIELAYRDISELSGEYDDDELTAVTVNWDDFRVIMERHFAAARLAEPAEARTPATDAAPDLVEVVARFACRLQEIDPDLPCDDEHHTPAWWVISQDDATKDFLAALRAAGALAQPGHVAVPVEAINRWHAALAEVVECPKAWKALAAEVQKDVLESVHETDEARETVRATPSAQLEGDRHG